MTSKPMGLEPDVEEVLRCTMKETDDPIELANNLSMAAAISTAVSMKRIADKLGDLCIFVDQLVDSVDALGGKGPRPTWKDIL